jgi:hypothetical protein
MVAASIVFTSSALWSYSLSLLGAHGLAIIAAGRSNELVFWKKCQSHLCFRCRTPYIVKSTMWPSTHPLRANYSEQLHLKAEFMNSLHWIRPNPSTSELDVTDTYNYQEPADHTHFSPSALDLRNPHQSPPIYPRIPVRVWILSLGADT